MGHGGGVEHRQVPVLTALYQGGRPDVPEELVRGKFTPNQAIEAAAIMLGRRDGKASPDAALAHLADQERFGHMSAGPDGATRNEIFAPAPHSRLWYLPKACIGLWARGELRARIAQWWADHFALVAAFWTPRGLVATCGRFKWPAGTEARPDWTLDNLMYAAYARVPPPTESKAHGDVTLDAFAAMLRELGDEIRACTPDPILAVPIARWARPGGGYLAAFVGRPPMNDPLGRVEVAADGSIVDAQKLPGELPPLSEAVLVGRAPGAAAISATSGPAPSAPATPASASSSPAEMLSRLTLSRKASGLRLAALAAIGIGRADQAADFVRQIRENINRGQQPAVDAILVALGASA